MHDEGQTHDGGQTSLNTQSRSPIFLGSKTKSQLQVSGSTTVELGNCLPPAPGRDKPQGIYAKWAWDGKQLIATNDRYGMFQVFYFHADNCFGISPSLVKLIEHGAPTELDGPALNVYFRLGYFLGEDTPFSCIKVLPPAATLTWSGELKIESQGMRLGVPQRIAREQAIDGYIDLFRQAMKRHDCGTNEFVMPLSGGKDSRHILLELARIGRKPTTAVSARVYPPRVTQDPVIAATLSQMAGIPHITLPRLQRFAAERLKNIRTSFCSNEHTWAIAVAHYLEKNTEVFYDGIGGDVLSQMATLTRPDWVKAYHSRRYEEFADLMLNRVPDRSPACWFEEELGIADSRSEAKQILIKELTRFGDCHIPVPMFSFWNKVRRELSLAPFGVISPTLKCFCPYLDHELFDFLTSLPVDVLANRLHTEVLAKAYPRFASIPCIGDGPRTSTRFHYAGLWFQLLRFARKAKPGLIKRRQLFDRCYQYLTKQQYRHDHAWFKPPNLLYVLQLDMLRENRRAE